MAIVVSLDNKKGKRHTPEHEARNSVVADVAQRLPRGGIVAKLQPWPSSLLASVFGLQTSADSAPHKCAENTPGSLLQITFLKRSPCTHVRPAFTPIWKELLVPCGCPARPQTASPSADLQPRSYYRVYGETFSDCRAENLKPCSVLPISHRQSNTPTPYQANSPP